MGTVKEPLQDLKKSHTISPKKTIGKLEGRFVSSTLYSLCLTGGFVTQSASSHFVPREHHFWCLFALLRLFLVAFLCNTTHRYGWQTENETPRHKDISFFYFFSVLCLLIYKDVSIALRTSLLRRDISIAGYESETAPSEKGPSSRGSGISWRRPSQKHLHASLS